MREIHLHDRYAKTPPDNWIGRRWQSTRKLTCGCSMTGIITALKPGAVRIETPLFNRTFGEAVSVGESRTPPIVGRAGVNQT